jgi:hypothetical protein
MQSIDDSMCLWRNTRCDTKEMAVVLPDTGALEALKIVIGASD